MTNIKTREAKRLLLKVFNLTPSYVTAVSKYITKFDNCVSGAMFAMLIDSHTLVDDEVIDSIKITQHDDGFFSVFFTRHNKETGITFRLFNEETI